MANRRRNNGTSDRVYFGAPKSLWMVTEAMKLKKCLLLKRKSMTILESYLKSGDITLPPKVCLFKVMVFPVIMYRCESWTLKKAEHKRIVGFKLWCWRKLLRVPWTEIKPAIPKGNQPWMFIGRTDAEAEVPILWPPDVKSWLIGKGPDAGKDWWRGEGEDRGWDGWLASWAQQSLTQWV